jgi:cysteine desulfurase
MICTMNDSQRIYLDYAAATPLSAAALAAMQPYLEGNFGNPSAIHAEGVMARRAIESARASIARTVQVRPEYITFTGGGTEGNNLAIFGVIEAQRKAGKTYEEMEVITTKIEHPSIGVAMERLSQLGVGVKYVAVDETGKIVIAHLKELLTPKTVLTAVAYANSEIGTIQPLHAIKKALSESEKKHNTKIFFHVDAAQAPLWISCLSSTAGADMLVLDFAKCNGPKGTGAVIRSRRAELVATVYGGGQEDDLRPGTENVPGIVGASVAFVEAQQDWKQRAQQVSQVRDEAIAILKQAVPELVINGAHGSERLANNVNVSISGLDTEFAAVVLDSKGFAVSTKSACAGAGGGESVVVKATTGDTARAAATLRFSLSPETTVEDMQKLATVLKGHIEQMNQLA